jgi:hypothetical protein
LIHLREFECANNPDKPTQDIETPSLSVMPTTLYALIRILIEKSVRVREPEREGQYTMMPQREASESIHGQTDPTYGAYEGDPLYAHQPSEPSFEQPLRDGLGGKVYPEPRDNKNRLRLMVFLIAMTMILICAVLFIFFMGGIAGAIGFVAAAFFISALSYAAIEKIQ